MLHARVLNFSIQIPYEKIVDPYLPPTLKKLEGHIAFGLSVCVWVGGCVC